MKKVSCFLSSTFNDMQSERDFFRLSLEDKVNDNLRKAGLFLEFIDLRWGVNIQTDEESDYDKKVLSVCLSEIKSTKPFFIVFLGERYGWVPNKEDVLSVIYENGNEDEKFSDKSITEIEINYALSTYVDTGKCLFYFRNPVNFGDDEKARQKYVSTGEDARKLIELKQKITKLFPTQVRTYDALWDKEKASFILENDFKEMVISDIENLFRDEYNNGLLESSYTKREKLISLTIEKKASLFAGRIIELSKAFEYLNNSTKKILDVVSEDGAGKSFFISKLAQELTLSSENFVLPYVCDSADEIFSLRELIEYFMQSLGCNDDVSDCTIDSLIKKFQQTVNIIGLDKPVVILIDSADRIIKDKKELSILNTYAYNNVKFIISRNHTYSLSKYISAMDSTELQLYNYSESDIKEIVKKFFVLSHRTVSEDFIREIILKEQRNPRTCSTPSYLTLLLHELDTLSEKDFKVINQRVVTNGLTFAQNVELYQKEIIEKAGKTFDEELYQQRRFIERFIPVAKYYFEYLAISPHGMSEREMGVVLEQFSVKQTPTDFSLFIKSFKCFLICDENGYWHFSQCRISNFFRLGILGEDREKYYRIILALYNESGKEFLKYQYALSCYFALNDFQGVYDFLVTNARNKTVLESFVKHINSSNFYMQEFFQLLSIDNSRELEGIISKIIRYQELDFNKWYGILGKFYRKNSLKTIMSNKEARSKVYNNLVALTYLAYYKGEYKKGLKLVSLLSKYFKEYMGTKLYHAYEIKVLDIILRAQLGQRVNYCGLIDLVVDAISLIKSKKEQAEEKWLKEKRKILNLLNSIDRIYDATEETKERDRFHLDFIDDCLELGYLDGDEYIYWVSKKFAYLSRNSDLTMDELNNSKYYNRWLQHQNKNDTDFLVSINEINRDTKLLLQSQYEEVLAYIRDSSSNQELVALCCINMAKYCDNFAVEDNYMFTDLAVAATRENLKNNFSAQSIINYQTALTQKVYENEMLGCLRSEDIKELLRVSKLSILIEPTTKNYDTYFEMHQKCKQMNLLSDDDIKDKNKYSLKRKKEVKFEVSENQQLAHRKQLVFMLLGFLLITTVFGASLYLSRNISFWIQFVIVILITGMTGYAGGIGINLFFEEKKKNNIVLGILLLSLSLISTIYLFTYSINDSILREIIIDSKMNSMSAAQYYYYMTQWGGKELLQFLMQLILIIIPLVFALTNGLKFLKEYRLWRSSSDIRNYKTYVLEYPQRKRFLIVSTISMIAVQILITIFLVCKFFTIKDLKYVLMFELELVPVLVIIIVFSLLTNFIGLFSLKRNLNRFKREKVKYDKKRANMQERKPN